MVNLDKFWRTTPNAIIQAIAIALVFVGVGGGFAIGNSSKFKIDNQGIEIERQAIKTQSKLENSVTLIEIQKTQLAQLGDKVEKLSKTKQVPQELVQEVEQIQEVIPNSSLEGFKDTVLQSEAILNDENSDNVYRNSEDHEP